MTRASDLAAGMWIGLEPSLQALLARLDDLSLQPAFTLQRQAALASYLRPYAGPEISRVLAPLPEEQALARLCLYADYLPDDGQPSLIEQVRDLVEIHVPQDEREWLDPLRHSWMDLLTVVDARDAGGRTALTVRSLGDGREYRPSPAELATPVRPGQALLSRLLARGDRHVLCGTGLRLSAGAGRAVLGAVNKARQEMEMLGGSFELSEWGEFAKRYGHLLLWEVAQMRVERLLAAETMIRYRRADGDVLLPAVALYDHHALQALGEGLSETGTWRESGAAGGTDAERPRVWTRGDDSAGGPREAIVARVTLTPTQLWVECDSRERLETVKHELAAAFGYRIHYRGEGWTGPVHTPVEPELTEERIEPRILDVSVDEERTLWASLLETLYLDWSDRPCASLNGETPRHAASSPATRDRVAALLDRMERDEPARRRTGRPAYDYDRLRRHLGL